MKLKLLNSKEMAYAPQKQAFPAREREIYWIAFYKTQVDLTNHNNGGENSNGLHGKY